MANCLNCGFEVVDGATYCPNCGASITSQSTQRVTTQTTTVYSGDVVGATNGSYTAQPQQATQYQQVYQQPVQPVQYQPAYQQPQYNAYAQPKEDGMTTAIKVLMIVGCVFGGFCYLIPLAWQIPMTVIYFKKVKNGEPISMAFKICSLLFVSLIAGILMLVQGDQQNSGYVPPVNNGMAPNGSYTVTNNTYYVQQPNGNGAPNAAPGQQPVNNSQNNMYGGCNPNLQ